MQPQPPSEDDPFRSMWQMSPVADARAGGKAGRRKSNLRLVAGIMGGLVMFIPFALIATAFWGWWQGEANWNGAGWATVCIGLAAGMVVGGFVATSDN